MNRPETANQSGLVLTVGGNAGGASILCGVESFGKLRTAAGPVELDRRAAFGNSFRRQPTSAHFEAVFRAFPDKTTGAGSSKAGVAPRLKEGGSWRKRAGCWLARRTASGA